MITGNDTYREQVSRNLERIMEVLAHISYGDLEFTLPEYEDDDEFAEVFAGLEIMVGDLRQARFQRDEQNRFNRIRGEIWKVATAGHVSRTGLIRHLLETAGPLVNADRVTYYRIDREREIVEIESQWCGPGIKPTTGLNIPLSVLEPLLLNEYLEIRVDADAGNPLLVPVLNLMRETDTGNILCVLNRAGGATYGFFAFSIKDTAHIWTESDRHILFEMVIIVTTKLAQIRAEDGLRRTNIELEHEVARRTTELRQANEDLRADIEQRIRMESEILRIRKLESVGLLAGGIAHDFNNILTGIITNIFMAKGGLDKDSESIPLLVEAEKAAFRASKLTKQLLTFSKGGTPVKEVTPLSDLLRDAVTFCLSGSKASCSIEICPDLASVDVDKGQIDQVLNNLIINADQSMPDGGAILVHAYNARLTGVEGIPLAAGDYACVSVMDRGLGIAPENLPRIFDPYFTTKSTGTGLGLTTSHSIISKHDGHLKVESHPGVGSVFTFYLPAVSGVVPDDTHHMQAVTAGTGRILVMDDDDSVRLVMIRLLNSAGYEAVGVRTGDEALEAYGKALHAGVRFNAAILDLTISGGKGGRETARGLLSFDPSARLIVVSGYSNDPVMANFREYGFCGVISKPFDAETFTRVIEEAARHSASMP